MYTYYTYIFRIPNTDRQVTINAYSYEHARDILASKESTTYIQSLYSHQSRKSTNMKKWFLNVMPELTITGSADLYPRITPFRI